MTGEIVTDRPPRGGNVGSTPPLRVLFVSHTFPPVGRPLANIGGMQRTAADLHEALAQRADVDLHTLALHASARLAKLRTPAFLIRLARSLPQLVRDRNIDVILFSSLVTALAAVPIRRALRARAVGIASIVHGRVVTRRSGVSRWLLPRVFEAVDMAFPVSTGTAAACAARGLPSSKIAVIPNGVNLDRFRSPADRPSARRALLRAVRNGNEHSTAPDLVLCSVGRHIERKGFDWFVRNVMPRVPGSVQYLLAGDGPHTPRIRRAIDEAGVTDQVIVLGRLPEPELAALYAGADLFVMPNVSVPGDFEGFGVVMLEAGACGLPIVASRLEGITDVVREGENGHLIASGDGAAFAETILRYQTNRSLLGAASDRAARYTHARFGWRDVAERYVRELQLVARAGARAPMRDTGVE